MNQLHITLEENSPAIKWANTQADRIGARGHVGTHLDCYTTVPEKPEYNITAMVLQKIVFITILSTHPATVNQHDCSMHISRSF